MEQAYAIRETKYRIGKYILRLLVIEGYLSAGQFETLRDLLIDKHNVVAELVNGLVRENASTAQSQDAYLRKYEALTQRYEAAKAELERLQKERTLRSQQDKAMALFIRTLKKQPKVLDAWDNTVWTVMVEKAIVHRDGTITFVFYNGTEIAVGRQAA